jgi:hypothetical protein
MSGGLEESVFYGGILSMKRPKKYNAAMRFELMPSLAG